MRRSVNCRGEGRKNVGATQAVYLDSMERSHREQAVGSSRQGRLQVVRATSVMPWV